MLDNHGPQANNGYQANILHKKQGESYTETSKEMKYEVQQHAYVTWE